MNDEKYCPMKYCRGAYYCEKEKCAWWCAYPNGEGECAIRSLPGLFEGLQDIAKEIGIK